MSDDVAPGKVLPTTGYYIAFIALGLSTASLGATLPELAEQTRSVIAEISYLFTAHSVGYIAGTLLGGRLFDRLPGHPLLAAVVLVIALGLVLVPLTPWLPALFLVWVMIGGAIGVLDVGGNALIVWLHRDNVAPFMNGLHFFFGVGALGSPVIIDFVAEWAGNIVWPYWVVALIMIPAPLLLFRLRSPEPMTVSEDEASGPSSTVLVALISVFFFTFVGAELGFGGLINTYAQEGLLLDSTTGRLLTSAFWGSLTAGRLLVIPVAFRVSPRTILAFCLAGCLAGLVLILSFSASMPMIWLGTLVYGVSMGPVFPTALNFAERVMTITGRVTGYFLVGGSVGSMTLPWVIGQLFEPVGPWVMLGVLIVDMVISVGIFLAILTTSHRREAAKAARRAA